MLRSNTSVSKKPRTKLRSKSRANFGNRKKTKETRKYRILGEETLGDILRLNWPNCASIKSVVELLL